MTTSRFEADGGARAYPGSVARNAARLRTALDDWNRGGLRALSDGWFADEILWHDLPDLPDAVTATGRAAVEARVREMVAAVGHWHFDLKRVEERGDMTISELELIGQGVQSGAGFIGHVHQIQRWRGARIVEVLTFAEREAVLAAAQGLSEDADRVTP